ncbi:polysaccharide deacetylase family protein [Dactylosporangium sp. AC04546]|uniref:polysaccharide deacetylase family protein n=1 Tax=Dactylosporangium sp. AC04546 TaxID=2862460 RepID=UPI001EDE5859|nr:polysaccharide deacetylase family protein [Dactylosporangium sp. AC04546]WVK88705.1 polysaccharide deacetylase family protein [Dactylosporangium sp. AC04546]
MNRVARTAGLAAAAGLAVHALPAATAYAPARRALLPALAGTGPADHVALTFDDGPDPASTPAFLRLLADHGVRATFFLLGTMLERDLGLGREVVAAGHEVAVHGWYHRCLLWRTPRATYDDMARARDLVGGLGGGVPRWYRPPYGVLTTGALVACRRLRLEPKLWTAWGRDWESSATPGSIVQTVTNTLIGGGTVLLHDSDCTSAAGSWQRTLDALPRLIHWSRDRGLRLGPLAEHERVSR